MAEGAARALKLCASRAFWLVGYPSQGHEMLFDAHTQCLTGLGGVAGRGIYDNMKTAVDRTPRKDRGRAGRLAHQLMHLDLVILDELGYLPFSQSHEQDDVGRDAGIRRGGGSDRARS